MKKMLTLVLVLAVASLASATTGVFTCDTNPGTGSASLSITPAADQPDNMMMIGIVGTGTLASVLGTSAPADSGFAISAVDASLNTLLGNGDIFNMMSYTSVYPTGVWLTATYSGAVAGDVIAAYESIDGLEWTQFGSYTIVPEPVTMALLGLGGLFLRRKK